jgi:hypothetical protein
MGTLFFFTCNAGVACLPHVGVFFWLRGSFNTLLMCCQQNWLIPAPPLNFSHIRTYWLLSNRIVLLILFQLSRSSSSVVPAELIHVRLMTIWPRPLWTCTTIRTKPWVCSSGSGRAVSSPNHAILVNSDHNWSLCTSTLSEIKDMHGVTLKVSYSIL